MILDKDSYPDFIRIYRDGTLPVGNALKVLALNVPWVADYTSTLLQFDIKAGQANVLLRGNEPSGGKMIEGTPAEIFEELHTIVAAALGVQVE